MTSFTSVTSISEGDTRAASHGGSTALRTGRLATRVSTHLVLAAVLLAAFNACATSRDHPSAADRAFAARITGVWDVELTLERSPLNASSHTREGPGHPVHGMLTLLESTRGDGRPYLTRPITHTGVYDLDLAPFDVRLEEGSPVPSLVAASVAPDSLQVLLPAGADDAALLLKGSMTSDTVRGIWTYGGRAVGGWGGTFVLVRHKDGLR